MAMGDDGGGSIRLPSAFCGLLGLHPTPGRIPYVDYKSMAPQSTVTTGPMTSCVRDAAIALEILSGRTAATLFACRKSRSGLHRGGGRRHQKANACVDGSFWLCAPCQPLCIPPKSSPQSTPRQARCSGLAEASRESRRPGKVRSPPGSRLNSCCSVETFPAFPKRHCPRRKWLPLWTAGREIGGGSAEVFAEYDFIVGPTAHYMAPTIPDWVEL